MFSSGLFTSFVGVIYKKDEIKKANNTDVISVLFKTSVGTGENRHIIYVEVNFWGTDAVSINKYPKGHLFEIRGDLMCEPYINSQENPAVRYKILACGCWQSLQSLPSTKTQKQQNENGEQQASSHQSKQMSEDELIQYALNKILDFGKYKGQAVKDVLSKDEQYIYDMAADENNHAKWRKLFATAYNYHYEQKQKKKQQQSKQETKNGKIPGVNRPHISANIPDDYPDEDLPF